MPEADVATIAASAPVAPPAHSKYEQLIARAKKVEKIPVLPAEALVYLTLLAPRRRDQDDSRRIGPVLASATAASAFAMPSRATAASRSAASARAEASRAARRASSSLAASAS